MSDMIPASLQTRDVALRALSQGIDTATPGGRLFFHMLAAIAEFSNEFSRASMGS